MAILDNKELDWLKEAGFQIQEHCDLCVALQGKKENEANKPYFYWYGTPRKLWVCRDCMSIIRGLYIDFLLDNSNRKIASIDDQLRCLREYIAHIENRRKTVRQR